MASRENYQCHPAAIHLAAELQSKKRDGIWEAQIKIDKAEIEQSVIKMFAVLYTA